MRGYGSLCSFYTRRFHSDKIFGLVTYAPVKAVCARKIILWRRVRLLLLFSDIGQNWNSLQILRHAAVRNFLRFRLSTLLSRLGLGPASGGPCCISSSLISPPPPPEGRCVCVCVCVCMYVCIYIYLYIYICIYVYICTGCHRRNGPNFGRVFLMLNYTDITQNTYIQSWTVTEIMAREKCVHLAFPRSVCLQLCGALTVR